MNNIRIDPKEFQKSITKELDTIKNRVRNLIGSSHWGEEGRYKEAILRNVIKRFLSSNLSIGTGFVIKKNNGNTQISNQIDIIIYDNTVPVLFSEGDFVITTNKNVKGIIEVKTRIRNNKLQEIIEKNAKINGKLIGKNIFNGIFSYEYEDDINSGNIDLAIKVAEGYVNHISLGPDVFIRFWKKEDRNRLRPPVKNCQNDFYNIYTIRDLSFSYFISNLLKLTCSSNLYDRWWFLYPIRETKEMHRLRTICLE